MKRKLQKSNNLTEKQKNFIESYRKNAGNISKVCSELNISDRQFYTYLQMPSVKEQMNKSLQLARDKIQAAIPYLIDVAIDLINEEKTSEKTKSFLIGQLLDRGGLVQPKQPAVQINVNTEISDRARQLLAQSVLNINEENVTPTPQTRMVDTNLT